MATDIVLKDRNGNDVTYEGIETVTFDTPEDGVQATFTLGVEQTGKEVELDLAEGDQVVQADDGYLLKQLTIKKPETLIPENIRYGENVGGVEGAYKGGSDRVDYTLNDNGEIVGATFYGNAALSCPQCTTLEWVDFTHSTATKIADYAFYECTALKSVSLPDTVKSVGVYSFGKCSAITSVTLPDGLTSINNNAFINNKALVSINIPDSVTTIGTSALNGCTVLERVTIGAGVTSIGMYAFYNSNNLTSITFADTTTWYVGTSVSAATTQVDVTNASTNATYFKSTYYNKIWVKK